MDDDGASGAEECEGGRGDVARGAGNGLETGRNDVWNKGMLWKSCTGVDQHVNVGGRTHRRRGKQGEELMGTKSTHVMRKYIYVLGTEGGR